MCLLFVYVCLLFVCFLSVCLLSVYLLFVCLLFVCLLFVFVPGVVAASGGGGCDAVLSGPGAGQEEKPA